MVVDRAGGMGSTHSRAGVPALVVDTGKVVGAFWVDGTLMLALHIRVTLETRVTCAGGSSISFSALCIDSTWTWSAGVNDFWSWSSGCRSVAGGERIPNESLVTDTDRNMISDIAVCINTTQSRTGVLTFSVDTCSL